MSDNTIEVLGQKLSYPTTWQGTAAVLIVCVCMAFLAYTLTPSQIDSYANLLEGKTEQKINDELLNTNNQLNTQIEELQSQVLQLSEHAQIEKKEKQKIAKNLETLRHNREQSYTKLAELQEEQSAQLATIDKSKLNRSQIKYYDKRQKVFLKHLDKIKIQKGTLTLK